MNKQSWIKVAIIAITAILIVAITLGTACAPSQKEVRDLQCLGGPSGMGGYLANFGLGEVLTKHSTWLRGSVVETAGVGENIMLIEEDPQNKIGYASTTTLALAMKGNEPYPGPMLKGRAIAKFGNVATPIVTLDPNIKTIADLKGKTVNTQYVGNPHAHWVWGMMANHGISEDEVTITYLGFQGGADALIAGKVDATLVGNSGVPISMMPITQKLAASKDIYAIQLDPADTAAAAKEYDMPFYVDVVKKADNPGLPADMPGLGMSLYYFCNEEMDDDVVTEICRVLYEHYEEIKPVYAGFRGLTPEIFTQVRGYPKEHYHPAAIKFWEEKGLQFPQ
ncbi:TAXI family TRAP transporter solute-binding subunit [Chloroflexota bacterium]